MLLLVFSGAFGASAQSVDQVLEAARRERSRLRKVSEDFRNEVRKQWVEYLNRPWTPVEADKPLQRPLEDDPDMPVMLLEAYDYDVGETFEIPADILRVDMSMYADGYFSDFPVFEETVEGDDKVSVFLNGYELAVRFPDDARIALASTSEEDVAEALGQMTDYSYANTLRDLSKARELLSLSDWSFVKLVEKLSDNVYGPKPRHESVLLQACLLNRFGFCLCIGRSDDGNLYKLMPLDAKLYEPPYVFKGELFYVIGDAPVDEKARMTMINLPSDARRPLRMRMNPDERFHLMTSKEKKYAPSRYPNIFMTVATDLSRMGFYSGYPMFYTEEEPLTTYFHHAMMPLSEEVKEAVYPILRQAVAGRSELEAVNILLNIVQTSFPYVHDKDAWGRERYFFADELWRYGGGDCEDKSILFSRLVRDILKLPVALVYWPGHLSCAVCFSDDVKGAYFTVKDKHYVSCDPTYENKYVGAVMEKFSAMHAKLILLP